MFRFHAINTTFPVRFPHAGHNFVRAISLAGTPRHPEIMARPQWMGLRAGMTRSGNGRSDIEKIEAKLPDPVARFMRRMRQPGARWIRIPAGVLLVVGGVLGFLPILGFWMLPLGLLLLAEDYPPAQRRIRSMMVAIRRAWIRQKRRFTRARPPLH